MSAMNISLTPDLDRFAGDAVVGGRYQSSSEVVGNALRRGEPVASGPRRVVGDRWPPALVTLSDAALLCEVSPR